MDRTDDWRSIFSSLVEDNGVYKIDKVNIYHLASHLEELYIKIAELEKRLDKQEEYQQEQNETL